MARSPSRDGDNTELTDISRRDLAAI
jgi:hypothetical protein